MKKLVKSENIYKKNNDKILRVKVLICQNPC